MLKPSPVQEYLFVLIQLTIHLIYFIWFKLVNCKEELLQSEDENRRLNSYIEQIISDIGDRAPALKRQRDEYETAVDKLKVKSDLLIEERECHEKTKEMEEFYRKSADALTGENFMLNCQVQFSILGWPWHDSFQMAGLLMSTSFLCTYVLGICSFNTDSSKCPACWLAIPPLVTTKLKIRE